MILIKNFLLNYSVRRQQDFNHTLPLDGIVTLPNNLIVHCLDSVNDIVPSYIPKNNPLLLLGNNIKYIQHISSFERKSTDVIELPDKGVRIPSVSIQKYISEFNHEFGKRIKAVAQGGKLPNILNTVLYMSYNPMFRAVCTGQLRNVKRFNYILSGVINSITSMPINNHLIYFPMPSDISIRFKMNDFANAFKQLNNSTIKYPNFEHYLMFLNLLAFVNHDSNVSMLDHLPTSMLDRINIIFTNDDNFVLYNLGQLKKLNGDTSIEEEKDEHGAFSGNRILYKLVNQFNIISANVHSSDEMVAHHTVTDVQNIDDPRVMNIPTANNIISDKTINNHEDAHAKSIKKIIETYDTKAKESIINNDDLTERQKAKAHLNSTKYKELRIGDKSFEEVLTTSNDNSLRGVYLDHLDNKVGDKSMLKSSIIHFDDSYMKKTFHQELVGILSSFNRLGMFLTEFKEEDISDELNQLMHYTVKYTDSTGKAHSQIVFTLPKVDDEGKCYINGVNRFMKKQRVNLPICKVSPNRITLTSSYNKSLMERAAVRNDFYLYFTGMISANKGKIFLGKAIIDGLKLPYEYSLLCKKILKIQLNNNIFIFDYPNRFNNLDDTKKKTLISLEKKYGVYSGYIEGSNTVFFMDYKGCLYEYNLSTKSVEVKTTIINKVAHMTNTNKKLNEYVYLKLVDKNLPVGFVLSYKYGFNEMLKYLNVDYSIYAKREKFSTEPDDIELEFKDCTMIIKRVPLVNSFIMGGLTLFNTSRYKLEEMDDPGVYYDMLSVKGVSTNYLKGIDSFFDLFIGYIEHKMLDQMGMPTEIRDLIIKAVSMLTTTDHKEASSSYNFRIRSYEKFNHIIYNELARAYATWKNKAVGHSTSFTVHPFIINQRIVEDASFDKLDVINPVHAIKMKTAFSHLGEGGRTASTFMIADRKFTKDSIGILSEATVDNSSVAVNGLLTMDPSIVNTSGMNVPKEIKDVAATELLSITSLLFPAVTQDDGKRTNFVSIQSSQFVPVEGAAPMRVRTGYESVVSHLCGKPFSSVAKDNGKIVEINDDIKMLKIKYKDDSEEVISYAKEYSNNSGSGFYVPQNLVINGFKVGDKVVKGDVVVYNKDYFHANKYDKQVDLKLGVPSVVAFIESDGNHQDSSVISKRLAKKLNMPVAQMVSINISSSTNIYSCVSVGDKVESTDVLMTFDENPLTDEETEKYDDSLIDVLNMVNRIKPKAHYTGTIVDITAYYKCPLSEMNKTVSSKIKEWVKLKNKRAKYGENPVLYPESKPLINDKVGSTVMTDETIIVKFIIEQSFDAGDGDKLFVASQSKSVISDVTDKSIRTLDGKEIDLIHSAKGVADRIVTSPYNTGVGNVIMEKLEKDIIDIWDA